VNPKPAHRNMLAHEKRQKQACGNVTRDIGQKVAVNSHAENRQEQNITAYDHHGIEYTAGDEITVGIYVKCAGPNAWGKIDDAMLNSVKE